MEKTKVMHKPNKTFKENNQNIGCGIPFSQQCR